MTTKCTFQKIQRFKRDAKKLKKSLGITHTEALDQIAVANGYDNWALLMHANADALPMTDDKFAFNHRVLLKLCKTFIKTISKGDIYRLCQNGSIWINLDDVINEEVSVSSLHALGAASDPATKEYSESFNAILLTDFNGTADSFNNQDDADEDNLNPQSFAQLRYIPKSRRVELIRCLEICIEADFETMMVNIDEAQIHQ